ncbi:MAG: ATP-binding protein [Acidobacteria bacterium]|nr:ATP-binding protein [Acidobacteriota bacterium]
MASEPNPAKPRIKRLSLGRSGRRLSFERRLRLWLYLLGFPGMLLCWLVLQQQKLDPLIETILLLLFVLVWTFIVSLVMEQVTRPLQTLANVVASLREDDYSFRARGARRNDSIGDLALEINALASLLQAQRAGALEAMALVERVMDSMQSPVLAFDPDSRLKLLNASAGRVFGLSVANSLGRTAEELKLRYLVEAANDDLLPLGSGVQSIRWMVKRAGFRLRGVPHILLVLADVGTALREEERAAWKRLIRVLGHEINNSLAPIKSIAESLRGRLSATVAEEERDDFDRGLEVIENRSESLNRFLQAYRQLMGLPVPKLAAVELSSLVHRVVQLETRLHVVLADAEDVTVTADADQIQQALINLVRNAAEAALGPDAENAGNARVEIAWQQSQFEATVVILDNGPGLTNANNLFVPFYTTKPSGTGIGLVLAQQIAEAHGGTVELRNRADGIAGCRAELRLPISVRKTEGSQVMTKSPA